MLNGFVKTLVSAIVIAQSRLELDTGVEQRVVGGFEF